MGEVIVEIFNFQILWFNNYIFDMVDEFVVALVMNNVKWVVYRQIWKKFWVNIFYMVGFVVLAIFKFVLQVYIRGG